MKFPVIPTLAAVALTAVLSANPVLAQPADPANIRQAVHGWRITHDDAMLRELVQLLALPNLASDSAGVAANARQLVRMLGQRGIAARLLEAPGSPPAVFGELRTPGAARTVMLYAHYDGQPVRPAEWATPPWSPTLRDAPLEAGGKVQPLPTGPGQLPGEWRLYARSASDDKAPIEAMLAALDALRASNIPLSVNVKFFFEGEEEAGSPHIREMLTRHADLLHADLWLFGDGPIHQSRRQQVLFGVRGVTGLELTLYGAARPLHSGHYGNWAPNPIARLASLLAGMRDEDGRILIPHFHDDVVPPTAAEVAALRGVPRVDDELRRELLLDSTEAGDAPLAARIMQPALNFRGVQSGAVGATASNSIPTEARASIDFRLVPNQTPEHVRALVEQYLHARGYTVVDHEPSAAERLAHAKLVRVQWEAGYPAVRTSMTAPAARALLRAADDAVGRPVIRLPTMGGSLPMYVFADVLHAPLVVFPIVNHDNNQHAANENLRLQNLFDGIELYAGVLARIGADWPSAK